MALKPPPPCTVGSRHKWLWQRDVTTVVKTKFVVTMRRRGMLACKCGALKYGDAKTPF